MYITENLKGTIYLPNGQNINFTENDIIGNSVSVSSQCMSDTSFSLGGVYSSQLSITIRLEGTNSYNVIGSKIKIYTKYSSETDYVLRGVFWITSASRCRNIYTLSGSDMITWLDTGTYNSSQDVQNYVYSYLRQQNSNTLSTCMGDICEAVNVILKNSQTDRIFFEWNHNTTVNNNPEESDTSYPGFCLPDTARVGENDTKDPRDYASWIAVTACGFIDVTNNPIDRGKDGNEENPMMHDGKKVDCAIKIGQFETEPTDEIPFSSIENDTLDIADFTINSFKVFFELNYLDKNNSEHWAYGDNGTSSSGIVDLSDNPFVQAYFFNNDKIGDNYNCMLVIHNIFDRLNHLKIRPFSLKCHTEKRFKLGQCITIEDETGRKLQSTITKMKWYFRGGCELGCAGEDNRILHDTVRRTPAVKAREQAVTKLNYEKSKIYNQISSTADGLQNRIDSTNQNITDNIENLQNQINELWKECDENIENSLYWHICRLRERIESLEEWRDSIDTQV